MKEFIREVVGGFITIIVWLSSLICLGLLFGCSPRVIPEGRTTHDTVYISKNWHDSVHVLDSVFIKEYMKGDTVYVDRIKWRELWSEKEIHDTIYKARTDTVTVRVIEYRQTKWQELTGIMGRLFIWLVVGLIGFVIFWWVILRHGDPP